MKNDKCIVVLSGGQDSTTCLFWAIENFDYVEAIGFNYNQKHQLELDCAKNICDTQGVKYTILDLSLLNQLTTNALTRDNIIPEINNEGKSTAFVDGRNLLFLTFASIFVKQKNINNIITGVCESDFSGYPDCRDIFIKSLNVTLNLAMDYKFVIHTPLMWLNKMETWKLADRLGVIDIIKNKTLTCYNGIIGNGCGECPACKLRLKGYEEYKNCINKLY